MKNKYLRKIKHDGYDRRKTIKLQATDLKYTHKECVMVKSSTSQQGQF